MKFLRVHFFNLVYKMHITKHLRARNFRIENMALRGSVLCCERVVDGSRSNKTEQTFVFKVWCFFSRFFVTCYRCVMPYPVLMRFLYQNIWWCFRYGVVLGQRCFHTTSPSETSGKQLFVFSFGYVLFLWSRRTWRGSWMAFGGQIPNSEVSSR